MLTALSLLRTVFRRHWPEISAAMAWIVGSWVRPGGSESGWEQGSG